MRRKRKWLSICGAALFVVGVVLLGWALHVQSEAEANAEMREVLTGIRRGAPVEIRVLLNRGASVHTRGHEGETPLHWACFWGDQELARECLAAGADVNAAADDGSTALMLAAAVQGRAEVIRLLLEAGADPNRRRPNGGTVLMHAAGNGDTEAVTHLLRHGADPRARLDWGETPLSLARKCVFKENGTAAARLLEEAGAEP